MGKLKDVLAVEGAEGGWYRGPAARSALARTFGGQLMGQALAAASDSVAADDDNPQRAHSLHCYFVSPGDAAAPVDYEVARVRDGRSFSSRHVVASQGSRTLMTLDASFHHEGDVGPRHALAPEPVDPEKLEGVLSNSARVPAVTRILVEEEWSEWDIRVSGMWTDSRGAGRQRVAIRYTGEIGGDSDLQRAALAYMSDMTIIHAGLVPHPGHDVQMASLDHSIWFHCTPRVEDWMIYDQVSPWAGEGRTLCQGRIFGVDGRLVATVVQEGLVRTLHKGADAIPTVTHVSDA